jgi:hypothetical protein
LSIDLRELGIKRSLEKAFRGMEPLRNEAQVVSQENG